MGIAILCPQKAAYEKAGRCDKACFWTFQNTWTWLEHEVCSGVVGKQSEIGGQECKQEELCMPYQDPSRKWSSQLH